MKFVKKSEYDEVVEKLEIYRNIYEPVVKKYNNTFNSNRNNPSCDQNQENKECDVDDENNQCCKSSEFCNGIHRYSDWVKQMVTKQRNTPNLLFKVDEILKYLKEIRIYAVNDYAESSSFNNSAPSFNKIKATENEKSKKKVRKVEFFSDDCVFRLKKSIENFLETLDWEYSKPLLHYSALPSTEEDCAESIMIEYFEEVDE